MMLAFEVYQKKKFYVAIASVKESPKCLLESAIYELNIKKEVIEKKNKRKN
jgi:hypothetical protein